jgi:hypothetical protein
MQYCVVVLVHTEVCKKKHAPNFGRKQGHPNMQYIDLLLDQAVNVLQLAPAGLLLDVIATSTHNSIDLHIADTVNEHESMSTTHDSDSLSEADTLCAAYDTQMDFD